MTTAAVAAVALTPYAHPDETASSARSMHTENRDTLLGTLADAVTDSDTTAPAEQPAPPTRSGHGRRVVFDLSEQRVWIVAKGGAVRRSYLVSGSKGHNLSPGRYRVYSRSRHAVGYDYHSTMQYFVRFAHGKHAAIGFHDIPVDHKGRRVQPYDELGTPQSAGCIRQRRSDARVMWRFADIGTRVVVVA